MRPFFSDCLNPYCYMWKKTYSSPAPLLGETPMVSEVIANARFWVVEKRHSEKCFLEQLPFPTSHRLGDLSKVLCHSRPPYTLPQNKKILYQIVHVNT